MAETRELDLILKLKDQASSELRSVGSTLSNLSNRFRDGEQSATSLSNTLKNRFSTELNILGKAFDYAKYAAIGFSAAAVGIGVTAIKTAANLEQERMAFKTLLGSVEQADAAIEMIKKDAATTPFELPGLIQANKLLTAVTHDAGKSEGILLNVGKALSAMGKGQEELDRIIVNLQQIGAVGHASMLDIKQFAFAGIPIFEMLQEATGKSGEALNDMISNGEISFKVLTDMFEKAGKDGGRFANAFADQAGTFNQLVSNMKDNFTVLTSDIAEESGAFDIAKNALKGLLDWVDRNKQAIIDFSKRAIQNAIDKIKEWYESIGGTEGLKKILEDVWNKINDLIGIVISLTSFIWDHRKAIIFLVAAWEALKLAMSIADVVSALIPAFGLVSGGISTMTGLLLSPVGLIAVLTTLATVAIVGAIDAWGDLKQAQEEIKTSLQQTNDMIDQARKKIGELSNEAANVNLKNAIDQYDELADKAERLSKMGLLESIGVGFRDSFLGKITRINDAVITPQGDVIQTDPSDYLIATKTPGTLSAAGAGGSGVVVNVNYPMLLDRNASVKLADLLSDEIRRRLRL
jgi:tape measure domain-containing protein